MSMSSQGFELKKVGPSPQCYIPSFTTLCLLILENIFEVLTIYGCGGYPDCVTKTHLKDPPTNHGGSIRTLQTD